MNDYVGCYIYFFDDVMDCWGCLKSEKNSIDILFFEEENCNIKRLLTKSFGWEVDKDIMVEIYAV